MSYTGMSFGLGETINALRDTVEQFSRKEIAPPPRRKWGNGNGNGNGKVKAAA